MQKLKNSIVEDMIAKKLTSKEIDFLLYISRFQDDNGRVDGVHYREVCENMHMSYQGFYDVKQSLTVKGLISCGKSSRIDHDITILGNTFPSQEEFKKGYINTNHCIFFNEAFYKLKAGAKLLAMKLMERIRDDWGLYHIGTGKFLEEYHEMFGVSVRVMRGYLMALKEFFLIRIKDGQYYISPKKNVYNNLAIQPSENHNYAVHTVEMFCRRSRIRETKEIDVNDTSVLIGQYKKAALDAGKDIIQVVGRAIEKSVETILETSRNKIRRLKPKLVHKKVREELGLPEKA